MATITRYINPASAAGGDGTTNATSGANRAYFSIQDAEAAQQQNLTDGGGDIMEFICETDGTDDTETVTIDGWTTGSANYLIIKTSAGHRHAGVFDSSKYVFAHTPGANGEAILVFEDYVRFEGIQFELTGASVNAQKSVSCLLQNAANRLLFDRCIFKGIFSGTTDFGTFGIHLTDADIICDIYACLFFDYDRASANIRAVNVNNATTVIVNNCTFHNCEFGVSRTAGTVTAENCGFASCATALSGTITDTNNSTTTPTFVDEANDDFHLQSGDTTWKALGNDKSGSFTLDIDGDTITTWMIGMDFVAGGGGGRTALNTRSNPLGVAVGMGWRMPW